MNSRELYEYGESALACFKPKAEDIRKQLVCPTHKRKALCKYDYLNDGTHAYITRYCCLQHAKTVKLALEKAKLFDYVSIENQ